MVCNAGHDFGMGCLYEQRSDPADESSRVADDGPGSRVGTEQTGVASIVEGVFEWIRRMGE
jgi:hypothetical protein